jgi:protocatechuate 3,4-dioxygenase, beta subunit
MIQLNRRQITWALTTGACFAALGSCSQLRAREGSDEARPDLYACEGCEEALVRDPASMPSRARLAPPEEPGVRLFLTGRVFAADGGPAEGIVVYAHHTNVDGLYANGSNETEWSRRHGRLRGWVKTDVQGRYAFDTIKPAPYPDRTMPAHIHLYIVEPGRRPYYVDDVVFAGEFKVDEAYLRRQELRGGSGIIQLRRSSEGILLAERNIRLERHPA